MGRDRATLHLTKLDAFARWAATQGYEREDTRGMYEVLRLRQPGKPPVIYYSRLSGEQATAHGLGYTLVQRWLRARKAGRG